MGQKEYLQEPKVRDRVREKGTVLKPFDFTATISKGTCGEKRVSIFLQFANEYFQCCRDDAMNSFDLAVGLWVITAGVDLVNVQ